MHSSIRLRLTLWFSALMVVALAGLSVSILWLHERWGRTQFDSDVATLSVAASRVFREELQERGSLRAAADEAVLSLNVPDRAIAFLDPTGVTIAGQWQGLQYDAPSLPAGALSAPRFSTVGGLGGPWRVYTAPDATPFGPAVILVAGPLGEFERRQGLLARILLVAVPLTVLLTATVSWWVASAALRPVTTMAAQAETITAHSRGWRLEIPAARDELGQLARAFNSLIDRLTVVLTTQRSFMADASHELRTPVSVIQTTAEVTLERETRDASEYREALTIVGEQSNRLSRMVDDMLVLARADADGYRLAVRPLYVDDIVAECARAVSVVAATKRVTLTTALQPDLAINADDGLLTRMVTNLLENAVLYTPPGGSVTVTASGADRTVSISVSDTGPGIPVADRERVFERFVRLDPARSATSGAGLGLPIARWIAGQHGGTLGVESSSSAGTVFVVRLPVT